jgi:hypothetical protein
VGRANRPLELLGQFGRALAPAGDVVAHMKHARGARRGREQRVERRDAPGVRGRNAESRAHVLEASLADPPDALLERAKRGKQQMPLLAHLAATVRYVGVVCIASLPALPRRFRNTEQPVDRGTLFIGWGDVPQAQIHQSSPAAASGSARRAL